MKKWIQALLFGLSAAVSAQAAPSTPPSTDLPGAQDHPMISRYPGMILTHSHTEEFGEVSLPTAAIDKTNKIPTRTVSGKLTRLTYGLPGGTRSVLEVYANYKNALESAGFQLEVELNRDQMKYTGTTGKFVELMKPEHDYYCFPSWDTHEDSPRYLLAHSTSQAGAWVAVYVAPSDKGYRNRCHPLNAEVIIIEPRAMDDHLVTVDASAMAKSIAQTGHVSIYGIYFDTDRSVLKPESEPTLTEITKLLASQPALNLFVVGHTDTTGELAHNMTLSDARANAVVSALTTRHGVASARLTARGIGPLSPVASNREEAGRSKNRRVELIER